MTTVPRSALAAMLLRSFAVQSSWNYRTLIGCGFAFALLPVLRTIYQARPEELQAAVQRHTSVFNSHPYFAPMALGAVAVLEGSEPPPVVDRFKSAVRGSLGSLGDRLIWAGLRPACVLFGLLLLLAGASWAVVTLAFLLIYNAGHLVARIWALRLGLQHGKRLAEQLRAAPLDRIETVLQSAGVFGLGAGLPLILAGRPIMSEPSLMWIALGIPGVLLGLWFGARLRQPAVLALTALALAGLLLGIAG